jgi:phosphoribosyl 1,2-cyclic phosphate phosphodiesterase
MRFQIVGSGGAVPTPKPGCHCQVCDEARDKGVPYARGGPATFLHGANVLFDTPEDIRDGLNRCRVERVDACFYSHWHPDHVMGRRIYESLNWDVRTWPYGIRTTDLYLPEQVAVDVDQRLGTGEHLAYMESIGIVRVHRLRDGDTVRLGDVTITPFRLAEDYVYAFLIEAGDVRALLAPDELHGWTPPVSLRGLDLAILPMGMCEHDPFTGERRMAKEHPLLQVEATFAQTLDMVHALGAQETVLTHIEEPDGLGHDDLARLAAKLHGDGMPIRFAHDGMRIEVNPH